MPVRRGEVYLVRLDPSLGHEAGGKKIRPVAVLSINDINSKPLVVTVVPGTSARTKPVHFRNVAVVDPSPTNGLEATTVFECHQLRAIDHSRFTGGPVGALSSAELTRIESAARYSLGLL